MADNPLMTAALMYAGKGWAVFPLVPGGKVPHKGTEGYKDATTDVDRLTRWWTSHPTDNIGLACGASHLVVVDLDTKGGEDGPGNWRAFCARQDISDDGALVQMTPSGGTHLVYKAPSGAPIRNSAGSLAPGVDVRGDGGYILAEPSTVGGREYVWEVMTHPEECEPAVLPDALARLLVTRPVQTRTRPEPFDLPEGIEDGRRNDTLFRLACSLRARGLDKTEILATVRTVNQTRCKPPKDDHEVQTLVASACTNTAGGDVHNTDLGNSRRLVALHGADLRWCSPWQQWLVWDGRRWAADDTETVARWAKDVPRLLYAEAGQCTDDTARKGLASWAMRSESTGRLSATVTLARSEPGIPVIPDALDRDKWLLNVQNGTLDLRTGTLRSHDRGDLVTKLAPVDYDPDAACPLFKAFLRRIFAGDDTLIAFVQRAVGYSLTGDVSERALFILHGSGANGKSTLLEALRETLGDYALRTPTTTLLTKRDDGVPNDVARLKGARFVSASESEDGRQLAEALVKDLTGGDTVSARYMRAEWFDFRPECKIWLGTNHKPRIQGTDNAIWTRIRLIPFNVTIPEADQDKHLVDKLQAETAGILAWAVKGCLDWQNNGLAAPATVTAATQLYRDESDVLIDFLEDVCTMDPRAVVTVKALHLAYTDWCRLNGETAMTKRKLGARLREKEFVPTREGSGARAWRGLGLLTAEPGPLNFLDTVS